MLALELESDELSMAYDILSQCERVEVGKHARPQLIVLLL